MTRAAARESGGVRPRLALLGCRGLPARYGGFETFAEELGPRLVARGFEVTVFCQHDGWHLPRGLPSEHAGVRLEHVAVPRLGPASALLYDLCALRRARAHEVVYMLGYGAGAFLGLGRRPGNRIWVNMDGLEWRRSKWSLPARAWLAQMEHAALRRADRLIFDSAAVQREVLGPDPRAAVIEYGARLDLEPDADTLRELDLRPGGYFFLVARIEPENHVLPILRAHARAAQPCALLVVGDVERAGRYGARCRAAAGRHARFLGALYDPSILAALRHGAAAVLHGHSVGGTNPALLEAMAAGAPVLAHENPFNREVLGANGLYFRDEAELVGLLEQAARWSAAERELRGRANRARIEAHYTWERITEAYAELLTRPAGPPGPDGDARLEATAPALPHPARAAEAPRSARP